MAKAAIKRYKAICFMGGGKLRLPATLYSACFKGHGFFEPNTMPYENAARLVLAKQVGKIIDIGFSITKSSNSAYEGRAGTDTSGLLSAVKLCDLHRCGSS